MVCWQMVILMGFFKLLIRCLLLSYVTSEYRELVELYAVFERQPIPQAKTFCLCPIDAKP